MKKIGIIGAGSWGTALAYLLANNGHLVTVWSALENEIFELKKYHENKDKLPGVKLPYNISFSIDIKESVENKDYVIMAVPSVFIKDTAKKICPFVKENQVIINVAKGIDENSLSTLSDIIKENIPQSTVSVLCGPTHAEEVGKGLPTTIVAGCENNEVLQDIQDTFMSPVFRVYTNNDVLGMEIGSALKNVIALAAGIADGLGCGDNIKAALITRGIHEISKLGAAMGCHVETFYGLTGIGDLIVTCTSMNSRNRRAGILIGQGKTYKEAMDEVKMVVEGVYAAKAGLELAKKYNVSMPIIETVNEVLFNNKSSGLAMSELMQRDKKSEK